MLDLDILALGNAIVDIITFVPDDFLDTWNLKKGSTTLIKAPRCDDLYKLYSPAAFLPGGCASNTMSMMALLGLKTGYIGSLKNDNLGQLFLKSITERGVYFKSPIATHGPSTGQCLVFVTPDKERTMETCLGASRHLNSQHILPNKILSARMLFLEAYLFDHDSSAKAALDAAIIAKTGGVKVVLSCSDVLCMKRHKGFLTPFIKDYVDILFGNIKEVCALLDEPDIDNCVPHLNNLVDVGCITLGSEGSLIISKEGVINAKSNPVNVVDTTGAGDGFAGGFLYGYLKGMDLNICGSIATTAAESILSKVGFDLDSTIVDPIKGLCV